MHHYYNDPWLSWYYDSPEGFGFRDVMRDSHSLAVPRSCTTGKIIGRPKGGVR